MPPEPPPKATSTTSPPSWMAPVMPVVPDHELVRRIGGGSYGDVWLARTTVGTWRAVKVVFRDRFTDARPYEREFNGIQKFEPLSRGNEAFIDILQIGRNDAEGYFYYVMELADDAAEMQNEECRMKNEGSPTGDKSSSSFILQHSYVPKTLSKVLLQRGRLPLSECLELGLTLNLGLAHLHRAGLIHRDIKPSNIIFVGGVPKLADIGLVIEVTEARSFVGTEGFIPPEGPNSPQADLFSLGKVLYEAGMGKDRKDFPEPFTQIVDAPDSTQLLEFNAILLKACAANVTERYQSAEEMNADLALLQSGSSVRQQRKVARQLRFVQRAGAVVTALAAVIALGWWWQVRQTARERDLAEQKAAAARESQRRLSEIQTANGLRAMEENDSAIASLWFAEALKLSADDPRAQARERFRLGTLFRQMPKPVIRFRLERPARGAWLTGRGERAIAVGYSTHPEGDTAELKVWEIASQRATDSLILSNVTATPVVSSNGKWAIVSQRDQTSLWEVATGQPVEGDWDLQQAAFSPDERRIAGTKTDGVSVFVRELPSAQLRYPPLQHSNLVTLVAFDPTGRWLLTASAAPASGGLGSARIWDAVTGKPMSDWIEVSGQPRRAAFSPDGEAVAIHPNWPRSAQEPLSRVVVLDLPSGQARFPRIMIRGAVDSVAFSPDGRHLAIGPRAFPVQVFNALTGDALHGELRHENVNDLLLRCSPDGAWLAAAGETGVQVWDLRSGAKAGNPLRLNQSVVGLDFLPAGERLLCADASGLISIYDLANSEMAVPTYAPPDRWFVTSGRFSPEGRRLATVSAEGDVNVWPLEGESRLPTELRARPQMVTYDRFLDTQIAWSPDGALLAVAKNDSTARLWDVATGRELHPPLQDDGFVSHLEFNSKGTHLATASRDGTARIWEVATGHLATAVLRHEAPVVQIRLSPDGRRALTGTENGEARWWDANSGEPLGPPLKRFNEITDLAISPDGSRAAIAGDGGEVAMLDARSGGALPNVAQHAGRVGRMRFSPDGRRLLTASHDKTARLWEVAGGRPVTPPLIHRDVVRTAEFSPDGRRLVTGGADGVARIWEADTGEPLSGPIRQAGSILSTKFSPDGNRVFVSSLYGTAEIREIPSLNWTTAEIIAAAQLFSGASLDQAGQTRPLLPAQAEEAWSKVEMRFRVAPAGQADGVASWHQQRLLLHERAHDWFAAEFHARQLVQLLPEASGPRADLARLQALRPPPRDPAAPAQLIDLTAYYNGPLAVNWLQGHPENHLAELPRGIQRLDGTLFDVRGLIQLRGQPPAGGAFKYPLRVDGIRIRQKLRHLHILHSTTGDSYLTKGASLLHYRVHYTGGRTEEIPIRYNVDISDWWEGPQSHVPEDPVAWRGMNPIARHHGMTAVRLFKCTWTNPAPELEISHVDFVSEGSIGRPFLIALTAE